MLSISLRLHSMRQYWTSGLMQYFFSLQLHRQAVEDAVSQSQSRDCEPPPPLAPPALPQNKGSYTNLFDASQELPLGGSAHSLRQHGVPDSPHHGRMPPRNLPVSRPQDSRAPVATPDQFSPISPNGVGTTKHVLPPKGKTLPTATVHQMPPKHPDLNSPGPQRSLASDQMYPTTQALITDKVLAQGQAGGGTGMGAKRSTSAGSLSGVGVGKPGQTKGVRTSPTYPPTTSHGPSGYPPTAPAAQHRPPHGARTYKESGYSSSSSGGRNQDQLGALPERPPPVGAYDNVPGAVRRPMSFVRALEMSDHIAAQERERELQRQRYQREQQRKRQEEEERKKAYGSTYEISV